MNRIDRISCEDFVKSLDGKSQAETNILAIGPVISEWHNGKDHYFFDVLMMDGRVRRVHRQQTHRGDTYALRDLKKMKSDLFKKYDLVTQIYDQKSFRAYLQNHRSLIAALRGDRRH